MFEKFTIYAKTIMQEAIYIYSVKTPDCGRIARLRSKNGAMPQSCPLADSHFASIENSFVARIVFFSIRRGCGRIDKLFGSDARPGFITGKNICCRKLVRFDAHESFTVNAFIAKAGLNDARHHFRLLD